MSDVRVKSWPLAAAGSLMLHATVMTGVYLLPAGGAGDAARLVGAGGAPAEETTPIYLLPDELPPDVAERLKAEQQAAEKSEPPTAPPKVEEQPVVVAPPPPLPKPFEPIPIPLGVVNGEKINTDSWLRNDAKGENGGMLSLVEQPRLDLNAKPAPQGDPGQGGSDGKEGAKEVATLPLPPSPAELNTPQPVAVVGPVGEPKPAAPATKASAGSVGPEQPKTDLPEGPSQPEIKVGDQGGEKPERAQAATAPRSNPAPAEAKPEVKGSTGAAGGAPKQADKAGTPGSPGVPSATKTVAADRDADAASVKRSAVFRNGKVDAGEGLDIRTVRPDFSLTTRALVQPRSPTLEVVFGKDGRARSVRVLKSSGFPTQVDEPVVSALYNWRAKGKVLDELPSRPDAAVSLEITIILQ